jgi:hypothetical protein
MWNINWGFDVCWAASEVSTREGEGVVCLLSHFIDVVVPSEGFMDVQTYVFGGVEFVQYLSVDSILVL